MVQALTQRSFSYVLESESGSDSPSTFQIRRLTARERAALEDMEATADTTGQISLTTGKANYTACRVGIEGWDGIPDLPYETETAATDILRCGKPRHLVTDECLDALPMDVIRELAQVVRDGQHLTNDQAGN